MENSWKICWACMNGPKLFEYPSSDSSSFTYELNKMELIPDRLITFGKFVLYFLKWTSCIWVLWFGPSFFTNNALVRCSWYLCYSSLLYFGALALRGTGRFLNPNYRKFITLLKKCESKKGSESDLELLTLYSFSSPWPAHFDVRNLSTDCLKPYEVPPSRTSEISPILWPLTWFVANTVGIYLAYPGCHILINLAMFEHRMRGLKCLRGEYGIRRAGLRTRHGEFVEVLYKDRRGAAQSLIDSSSAGHGDSKGEILVICCEGNCGYSEIGIMSVPLKMGYSTIGWNHPGFGSSTGIPLPHNEQAAVEAVLLFAVHHLHFRLDQIVLFGWSIGGYSATWAAMNYPEVAGLILDATFDNIDELGRRALPSFMHSFTLTTIWSHLDLNNLYQLNRYDGPVRIIRRKYDEVISTGTGSTLWESNLCNQLFVGLLKRRYPHLMTEMNEAAIWDFLSLDHPEEVLQEIDLKIFGSLVVKQLNNEALERQNPGVSALAAPPVVMPTTNLFPSELGSQTRDDSAKHGMLFYLVSKHFVQFVSSHCTVLPCKLFSLPWSPFTANLSRLMSGRIASEESVADEEVDDGQDPRSDDSNDNEDVVVIDESRSP